MKVVLLMNEIIYIFFFDNLLFLPNNVEDLSGLVQKSLLLSATVWYFVVWIYHELFVLPIDNNPLSMARILQWVTTEWVTRGSSWPRDWTHISWVSCIGRWILYHWATWEAQLQAMPGQKSTCNPACLGDAIMTHFYYEYLDTFSIYLSLPHSPVAPTTHYHCII